MADPADPAYRFRILDGMRPRDINEEQALLSIRRHKIIDRSIEGKTTRKEDFVSSENVIVRKPFNKAEYTTYGASKHILRRRCYGPYGRTDGGTVLLRT